MIKTLILIFLGGGTGSVLRYAVGRLTATMNMFGQYGIDFQHATFIANILGCFLIGLFNGMAAKFGMAEPTRLMLTVGLCGGFTTFSTLSNESLAMLTAGNYLSFCIYVGLSLVFGILAVLLGSSIFN